MHAIRTNSARNPGQPIAMSEKSSNFAVAFVGDGFANESLFPGQRLAALRISSSPQKSEIFGDPEKKTSLHESTTIAPHYLHDSVCSACVIVVFYEPPAGVPGRAKALFQRPEGVPLAKGCSNCASRVPEARRAVPIALRAFQRIIGRR